MDVSPPNSKPRDHVQTDPLMVVPEHSGYVPPQSDVASRSRDTKVGLARILSFGLIRTRQQAGVASVLVIVGLVVAIAIQWHRAQPSTMEAGPHPDPRYAFPVGR